MENKRMKREKQKPKSGKYLYEYVFSVANGTIVEFRGKNKYLIIYRRGNKYKAVNKSNGEMVPAWGMINVNSYLEIGEDIKRKHLPVGCRRRYYSLSCFSRQEMENLIPCDNKKINELKKSNLEDERRLAKLEKDLHETKLQIKRTKERIQDRNSFLKRIEEGESEDGK